MSDSEKIVVGKNIEVYVRLADRDPNTRTLTFHAPADITQEDALDGGLVIDGSEYVADVSEGGDGYAHSTPCALGVDEEGVHHTLMSALGCAQNSLASWLGMHGYEVDFR